MKECRVSRLICGLKHMTVFLLMGLHDHLAGIRICSDAIYRLDLMYDRFLNKEKTNLRQNIFTAEYSKCRHRMASMQSRQTNIENNY